MARTSCTIAKACLAGALVLLGCEHDRSLPGGGAASSSAVAAPVGTLSRPLVPPPGERTSQRAETVALFGIGEPAVLLSDEPNVPNAAPSDSVIRNGVLYQQGKAPLPLQPVPPLPSCSSHGYGTGVCQWSTAAGNGHVGRQLSIQRSTEGVDHAFDVWDSVTGEHKGRWSKYTLDMDRFIIGPRPGHVAFFDRGRQRIVAFWNIEDAEAWAPSIRLLHGLASCGDQDEHDFELLRAGVPERGMEIAVSVVGRGFALIDFATRKARGVCLTPFGPRGRGTMAGGVAIDRDGERVAVLDARGYLALWSVKTLKPLAAWNVREKDAKLAFSDTGRFVVADGSGLLTVVDTRHAKQVIHLVDLKLGSERQRLVFTPGGYVDGPDAVLDHVRFPESDPCADAGHCRTLNLAAARKRFGAEPHRRGLLKTFLSGSAIPGGDVTFPVGWLRE